MADETEGEVTVEVTAPVVTETPEETAPVVVVETPAAPEGDSVDALEISELIQSRERIANLERDLEELRAQQAATQATAESTAEIVSMEAEIADEQQQQIQEQLAEIESEMEPPDIAPNNSHPWFRTRDEWKGR